jgi:REP element-mobilizing transposase RayT
MGDRYKIYDPNAVYFITMTIVEWIDIFTRKEQKLMIVDSLRYCQKEKGLLIYGWCLMPSHLHIICSVAGEDGMSSFLRDFKKFTSKEIVKLVKEVPESRRDWILQQFKNACKHLVREQQYKVWQDGNQAKIILSGNIFYQKLSYIHNNPVEDMLVVKPEDYMFSSARNYADLDYLLEVIVEPQRLITVR